MCGTMENRTEPFLIRALTNKYQMREIGGKGRNNNNHISNKQMREIGGKGGRSSEYLPCSALSPCAVPWGRRNVPARHSRSALTGTCLSHLLQLIKSQLLLTSSQIMEGKIHIQINQIHIQINYSGYSGKGLKDWNGFIWNKCCTKWVWSSA